jgi:hypothetical protein
VVLLIINVFILLKMIRALCKNYPEGGIVKDEFLVEALNYQKNSLAKFWKPLWFVRWLGTMVVLVKLRNFYSL